MSQVLEVAPLMALVPLNHCHTLAPVFSESLSTSDQVPAPHVRVLPALGVPLIEGAVMDAPWSG